MRIRLVLSLFNDPDLVFDEKAITIKEGRRKVKYYGAAPELIKEPPQLQELLDPDITFDFPLETLSQIHKASSVLGVPDFAIFGDGVNVTCQVGDRKNDTSNTFANELGESDKEFRVNLKVENLRFLSADYSCAIKKRPKISVAIFTAKNQPLTYYAAIDTNDSTFNF